jgi:hypothetical protein
MEQISTTIIKFSFIPIVAIAIYAGFIYKSISSELRPFAWFVLLSGVVQLCSAILWFSKKNNLPLLHLYVAAGFVFLAMFYQKVLDGFVSKTVIQSIVIAFLVFTIFNSIFIQPLLTFNSYALTAEAVIIIILSISTYLFMMNDIVKKERLRLAKSLTWINSGLFVYYASSLLIFYVGDIITLWKASHLIQYTWVLHIFFSNVMYCCFFVGLWTRPRLTN